MGDDGWFLGPALLASVGWDGMEWDGMEWDGMRLYCRAEVSYVYLHVACFSRQAHVSPGSRTRSSCYLAWESLEGLRLVLCLQCMLGSGTRVVVNE